MDSAPLLAVNAPSPSEEGVRGSAILSCMHKANLESKNLNNCITQDLINLKIYNGVRDILAGKFALPLTPYFITGGEDLGDSPNSTSLLEGDRAFAQFRGAKIIKSLVRRYKKCLV